MLSLMNLSTLMVMDGILAEVAMHIQLAIMNGDEFC